MTAARLLQNIVSGWFLLVEAAWGADLSNSDLTWVWSDITSDVMQDNAGGISITVGRGNGAQVAQPANCTFRLKNGAGAYTPGNPGSANYPNVRLGTPIRVSVSLDGGLNFIARFQGEASSWAPGWDAQGNAAYVSVTASGITRRLGSGSKPLQSPLYRAYTKSSIQPLAYWPMEDGASATQIASGLVGGQPAVITSGSILWAHQITSCPGSDGLPDMAQPIGAGFSAATGPVPTGGDTFWAIDFTAFVDGADIPAAASCAVLTATMSSGTWDLIYAQFNNNFGSLQFFGQERGTITNDLFCEYDPGNIFDGLWHHYRLTATQNGSNIDFAIEVDGTSAVTASFAGTIAHLSTIEMQGGNPVSYAYGHVAVFDDASAPSFYQPSIGYAGESATDRITRLCTEDGIALTIGSGTGTSMGAQSIDTFLNLLRECETADQGYLFDGLGQGLNYVPRADLYNESAQLTIDASSGQVPATPGPLPVLDDQRLINRVTATNKNGSAQVVVEDADGPQGTAAVGVFDARLLVNADQDAQLLNLAAWLIHLRTPDGMRYPQILFDMAAAPELATNWIGAIPSDRIDLTNLSDHLTQHPPGSVTLLADGWNEALNTRAWRVTANCSPFQPWVVGTLNGLFRLEMAGQTLASSLASGATTLSLATASGHSLFTTNAADFPMDLNVAGWKIHVTNASGSSSPQTLTISASPNTSTISSGTSVSLWQPAALAL